MEKLIIPEGFEIISMGFSLWLVDSQKLQDGQYSGKKIVADLSKDE